MGQCLDENRIKVPLSTSPAQLLLLLLLCIDSYSSETPHFSIDTITESVGFSGRARHNSALTQLTSALGIMQMNCWHFMFSDRESCGTLKRSGNNKI
uniref:Putative secreted protein n=1 Tax=Anopheles triannulatus TaxID=58253 RepID=A0A2M4B6D3_9DIPT